MSTDLVQPPFTAVANKIGRLLASANVDPLAVPRFQREFAWTKDEVEKLLRDLARAQRTTPLSPDYFLGSIVMSAGKPLEIIDGQQRLATTVIIFAAIRNALFAHDCRAEAENVHESYLVRKPFRQESAHPTLPRLTLNQNDKGFFWGAVIDPPWHTEAAEPAPRHDSHFNILDARKAAHEWFDRELQQASNKSDVIDICEKWINQLTDHVVVAAITAVNRREAFRMFATLNDRGLRVTQADLVKSHLFETAASTAHHDHGESFDIIDAAWSATRTTLDSVNDEGVLIDYIRHFLTLRCGLVREDQIYEKAENQVTSEPSAVSFAESLASTAKDYAAILSSSHPRWANSDGVNRQQHRTVIAHLNSGPLDLQFHRSLLLAICNKFDAREQLAALNLVRALSVRLLIHGGTRSGKTETAISNAAHGIFTGRIRDTDALRIDLTNITPSDTAFRTAFAAKRVSSNRDARYLLIQIENHLRRAAGEGTEASEDTNVTTLEHILPKGTIKESHKAAWNHFDSDSKRAFCTRLGNMALALMRSNSIDDQAGFPVKRGHVLSAGSFLTNSWFRENTSQSDVWTEEQIDARQLWLAEQAVSVWQVQPA